MRTPPRLIGQIAAEATTASGKRVTEHQVRRALYLSGLAASGRTFDQAVRSLRLSRGSVQAIARRWIIDFPDYRPFRGDPARPAPIGRLAP